MRAPECGQCQMCQSFGQSSETAAASSDFRQDGGPGTSELMSSVRSGSEFTSQLPSFDKQTAVNPNKTFAD